jgi:hypothetical protein
MHAIVNTVRAAVFICALAAGVAGARDDIRVERVTFEPGTDSAVIKGTITGYAVVDYMLGARQGQTMTVDMSTDNSASYFNILAPGEDQVALFNGSINGNQYETILPASGDYTVRVYMMRSAARRDEVANFSLSFAITGSAAATAPSGAAPAADAKVEGTPYHAIGQVPCSMGDAPPGTAQCDFGVIRGEPGNAEVHITPPGGFERVLSFGGDTVSSDADARVQAQKKGDTWVIEVNDYEHYQIPEAVITGG